MATASVASMNSQIFATNASVVRGIIRVWMSDSVGTDSFHHSFVVAPF
jgi:hypothetical protein